MIDSNKIAAAIESYKHYFPDHWADEMYKWEAVKHFQEHWDMDAPDFGEMFKKATDKTSNLLASGYAYPRGMILEFAKADDDAVREMFRRLYDERLDLTDRINGFIRTSGELRQKYGKDKWKQHYQNTNYISTYLWLMYPDKYYIYKYELFRKCAELLDDSYRPKANGSAETMIGGYRMYDEIRKILQADGEIRQMLQGALTESCYPDPELVTATIDFGFYVARFYLDDSAKATEHEGGWFPTPEEYDPGLSVEDWRALLADAEVFDENSLTVVQRIYDMGGQATCKELSDQYGEDPGFYNVISSKLAKRVRKKTDCPLIKDEISDNAKWWPILYVGHPAGKDTKGAYVWRLRDELKEALETMEQKVTNSWLLAWNPKNYDWEGVDEKYNYYTMLKTVRNGEEYFESWRCHSKQVKKGDRIYIIRLGVEPKGIVATGYAASDSYEENGISLVDITITNTIDYKTEEIIPQEQLIELFPDQQWSPRGSGISIKPDAAQWLIKNWSSRSIVRSDDNTTESLTVSNSEFLKYFSPLIQALKDLGGSATRKEAHEKVIELMGISDDELSVTYEKTGASRVLNQIDFARNDLAHEGFISSEIKGVWALTELGMTIEMTRELAGRIRTKWIKICTAKRKGEPVPVIDLSQYYKKKVDHKYTKKGFLNDVFITESEYDKLRTLVLRKKNIILQGAPGVGKTYAAKRLAYSIIGEKNENRICMVQFHQSYSYEDFIMGYRPNDNGGFEMQSGVFYNFCIRCKENPDEPYFFIIDEINRGNLSKIFGELLMLIEADKRGAEYKLNLVYDNKPFYIPENLHIIGMMNTADRSLAMIDYALRRRFSFYTMQPAFEHAAVNGFKTYTDQIACERYHTVIAKIRELNAAIRKDTTLGKGFEIGHSYFSPADPSVIDDAWVRNVVEYEIVPLLEEYWFDDGKKVEEWAKVLYQALGEDYDS
ncbi:MAG: AAA family ATPase [Oscillospiraceae bacterium]|nr:AAA family ATPase [Oscillospiraceae bacterium]